MQRCDAFKRTGPGHRSAGCGCQATLDYQPSNNIRSPISGLGHDHREQAKKKITSLLNQAVHRVTKRRMIEAQDDQQRRAHKRIGQR